MSDSEAHEMAEARLFVLSKIVERFDVLPEETSWGGIIGTIERRIEEAVEAALAEEQARHAAEIAARERAAREAALREAAAEVDCGCKAREDVLKWLAESGERRARSMCAGHGDACCALQAAAILALLDKEAAP